MILLVTYDLKQPQTSYEPLFEELKSKDSWAHYIPSTWLVSTRESPRELSQKLIPLTFKGDRLLVVELTGRHSGWLPQKAWDWIERHRV